ncbi:isopenicillin N synthase-like dioxygenase [Rhodopseudomonas rhenobacensis]|uniref:2-oxoglutarate-dependent ethylene/succinate-forming enzyme n=1 Tax=Rhodopseudomonas rhenobacensis TaxID=87461 RepID=A0A7W8E1K0_9BRAD|nr:isopenicillin N synthase family oxygenase [Rhodopseudomonas rhenobacensis]MBB5049955.1 isopenicillin N synthase-like dioxygenase [Rhodopseudomonas rhenobacensis]
MLLYSPPKVATSIPIIDIGDSFGADQDAHKRIALEMHKACRETGFFYVSNHGVPSKLIDAQFAAAKSLFDLPLDAKLKIHMKKSPTSAGYEPIGGQTLDSQDDTAEKAPPDLKESFYCGLEIEPNDPRFPKPLRPFGYNQWPEIPGLRDQFITYYGAMTDLGARILRLLALSLELPSNWFERFYAPAAAGALRLIKYPSQPSDAAFNQIGAGAHTDWGGITILAQDSVGGLEVKSIAEDWIKATPIPGTFVINLGDLMARWTNGVYMSNLHRVNNNVSDRDRYSIPFFYSPFPTSVIEAIPTCVDEARPPLFATCTAEEHLNEMFRRSYGYEVKTA